MTDLIAAGLKARTVKDVNALETALERTLGGAKDRYLGDRATNWSALSSGVDPRNVLFERVTNMWDALLEAEAEKVEREKRTWTSPKEAAHALLGVPLAGPAAMDAAQRELLTPLSLIQVLDSDDSVRRPSVAFRDRGIGLTAAEMPQTILAIEGSNKLDKRYLHGVFGKGGSVLCMFSKATIVITRKQPELLADGEEDRVSMAIIRQGDAPDVRLPYFRYKVSPEDHLPYSVPAAETEFEPGTYVVHIGYQGDKLTQQTWEKEESVYAFAETLLFRPTLPYQLHDARTGAANVRPEGRRKPSTLQGLGQRLGSTTREDGLLDASGVSRVPIPNVGEIGLRWWLFENTDRRRRRAAKGFVGLFVTGGQVHHAWSTNRFTQLVEARRRVAQRIIVEVDTEDLAQRDKVRIFSSFRDVLLKSPEALALERAVAEWLSRDADLDDAETQLTIEALGGNDREVSAAFRDRLNRAVRSAVPGLRGAGAGAGTSGSTSKPPAPRLQEDLHDEPTDFTGPESIELLPGQRKSFHMECNAVDGFVPSRGEVNVIAGVGSPPVQFGRGDLRRGRLQVSLLVAAEASLGSSELEIALVWNSDSRGRIELRWPLKVSVVAEPSLPKPPRNGKDKKKKGRRGDVAFIWTDSEKKKEWNSSIVGDLEMIKGSALAELQPKTYGDLRKVEDLVPTVVLNRSFRDLDSYLKGIVKRTGDQALELRRDKYGLALGVTIANMFIRERKLTEEHSRWEDAGRDGPEPERPMSEAQRQRALVESARGVLALLPDFDALLDHLREPDDEPDEAKEQQPV